MNLCPPNHKFSLSLLLKCTVSGIIVDLSPCIAISAVYRLTSVLIVPFRTLENDPFFQNRDLLVQL